MTCDDLIRPALTSALDDATVIAEDDGDCRVIVPLERADGDMVTLWIIDRGDRYQITDEGETHGLLYLSNINLGRESRKRRVDTIQERFGLDNVQGEVRITADESSLGKRMLDAVQAVQALSYLTYTRRQYTQTDFRADVGDFLLQSGFRYDANPEVEGASERHRVDFSITGQPQATYLEALHAEDSSTAKTMAQRTMYKWTEINAVNSGAMRISVIDDESGEYGHDTERILRNYSDIYLPWSQRGQLTDALTG